MEYGAKGADFHVLPFNLAKYVNSRFALVLNSCTSALFLACKAIGIKKNDLVWTTPISFVATSNSALYCGAKIEFIDRTRKKISPKVSNEVPTKLPTKLPTKRPFKQVTKKLNISI